MRDKHESLRQRWYHDRLEYDEGDDDDKGFTWDGPSDWNKWESQKPKILFLLKEAHNGFHPDEPKQPIKDSFGLNIARWKFAVKNLYKNPNLIPEFPRDPFLKTWTENNNDDITIVEVKKKDAGQTASMNSELKKFAQRDKLFLAEQIDIIAPDIVLCGNTGEIYGNIIYGDDDWEELCFLSDPLKCKCYKHFNRLVIDFYHPASRAKPNILFDTLCNLLSSGKVFGKFYW